MIKKWLKITNSEDGKTAIIDIEGTIGGSFWDGTGTTKEDVKAELKQLAELKPETIIVNIDSLGGDIAQGFSIHDLLASNKANKEVRINGATASAATIIAMAGSKGKIKMSDNALFLVHHAMNLIVGNKNDVKAGLEELEKFDGRMVNIYAKRMDKPEADILAQLDINNGNGEWMTAEEAKTFGFVDEVFEPSKIAAMVKPEIVALHKLPAIPTNKIKSQPMEFTIEGITAAIKDGIAAAFKGKEAKPTEEQLNKIAGEQAAILKADYTTKIADASTKVKAEAEAAHKIVIDAKEKELTTATAEVTRLTAELEAARAGETKVAKVTDPPIGGGAGKKTKNQASADRNAAALKDEEEEDDDEEAEETTE